MMRMLTQLLSIGLLIIAGCTFYSGESLLNDITCAGVDSLSVGLSVYHSNPNQYTRRLSSFVRLRRYKIVISDSMLFSVYRNDICSLIKYSKESEKVSRDRWYELLERNAEQNREIEKKDSMYVPGGGITLYLSNGEVFGVGRNLIDISRIDGTYLGLPLSKGAFSYATGVYHNDSTLNNFIFDFCNQIIADKNRELQDGGNGTGKMRLDIVGDTVNATPIPFLKYRF